MSAKEPVGPAKQLKVISETTTTGFGHVKSVAYNPQGDVLYTSDFGPELKPADKDGKGKITKVSLDGKILRGRVPSRQGAGASTSRRASGSSGNRMWVTDIDAVWVFDLKTKEGRSSTCPASVRQRPNDDRQGALC